MLAAYPPVFAGLSMDASQEAASALQQIEVEAGGAIMIEGEADTTLAFIVSGSCEIWHGETKIGTAGARDILGEVELFARIPRVASVTASNHVTLQILDDESYAALCERGNPVVYALERAALRRISDRLRTMNNSIRSNSEGTPFELHPQRVGLLSGLMSAFMRQKMPEVDAATVLAGSDLFSWAPGHVVMDISEQFEVEEFKKDAVICRQGEDGDSMFVLASGSVEVVLLLGPDRAESVATLVPGQAFGDASIALRSVRTATCVAREDTVVLTMPRVKYMELHGTDTEAGSIFRQGMIRNLIVQLLATTERFVAVAGKVGTMEDDMYRGTPIDSAWRG